MSSFETKATIRSFGGKIFKLTHQSPTTTTPMNLNLYLPPAALTTPPTRVPVLMYLSGLTGTYYHDVYSRPLFLLQSMSRAQFLNSPLPQWNIVPYHKNYILTLTSSTSQTPPLPQPSPPTKLPPPLPQPLPTLPPTNPPPVHPRQLHRKRLLPTPRLAPRPRDPLPRHLATRTLHPRRQRLLRLWRSRVLLPRRDHPPLLHRLQHGNLPDL